MDNVRKILQEGAPTPRTERRWGEVSSQVTPVSKILEECRKKNLLEERVVTPVQPVASDDISTPNTPLGAFITDNPSKSLRKEMVRYINRFPEFKPFTRRESTVCIDT